MAIRLVARTASGDITDGITQSGRQTAVASRTGGGREAGGQRIWSKDFILVMVIATLASTAITTQMGTLPLYVASLGGSTAVSGAIVGILGISALIFRFPTGVLLDRYGRRVLLIVGLAILLVDFSLLNVFRTLLMLFCLRFLQGIGNGIQTTSTSTLAADLIPPGRLQTGLGYFSLAQVVPSAIGPLIGLSVVEHFGYRMLFVVGVVLTAAALALSLLLTDRGVPGRSAASVPEKDERPRDGGSLALLIRPGILLPSAVMFVVFCAAAGVTAFVAQFAVVEGIANAGVYFVVASASTVMVRLFVSPQLIRFRQSVVVLVSLTMVCATFFLVASAQNLGALLLAAVLYGAGQANLQPMMNTLVLEGIEPDQRGRVTAFFSASADVAYGGGALLWGIVAGWCGFRSMYVICGVCALLGFVFYLWLLIGRSHERSNQ
ncbi:major facilitator superfamily permease [Bifidobacterium thermophilum]|nr:major facilitator superfamily permease [Bifidobacterium thermophilum]